MPSDLGTVRVDARQALGDFALNVEITGASALLWRIRVAEWLVRVAGRVAGARHARLTIAVPD